jgi:nucleotide-binding universal stress UspA family protein
MGPLAIDPIMGHMALTGTRTPGPIVVGVERSDRSRDALAFARTLARAVGGRLILVAVYPIEAGSAVQGRNAYAEALAEEALDDLERVARPLAGVRAELRAVPCTSVARGLQRVAEDEQALAIVVGPSHRGPAGRLVPGSVGERLLRDAPCPVAVAPRGHSVKTDDRLRAIGVGYVGTPDADEALGAAVGLAARTGAEVHAVSVVEPPPVTVAMPSGWNYRELEATAREDLNRRLRHAVLDVVAPVEISAKVVDGYADDELARLSDDVDLLVCGSRGHGPTGAAVLGSVSAGVMRKARCPVLVVPFGAHDGFAALDPLMFTHEVLEAGHA